MITIQPPYRCHPHITMNIAHDRKCISLNIFHVFSSSAESGAVVDTKPREKTQGEDDHGALSIDLRPTSAS